jgi:hypothetical protein
VNDTAIPIEAPDTEKATLPENVLFADAVKVTVPVCPRVRFSDVVLALTETEGAGGGSVT